MEGEQSWPLIVAGALMLLGYAAHALGARMHVPRVTLLLLLGLVCGPAGLDLVPHEVEQWFPLVAHVALAMIGFLLGERFLGRHVRETGRVVLAVSLGQTLGTAAAVGVALALCGAPWPLVLALAGIAPAVAPAATYDVVRESGARGPLSDVVVEVVAIDDAWGVILFSLLLVGAEAFAGVGTPLGELGAGLWQVAGAAVVGVAVGLPMAWLTGRLGDGEPALLEGIGFVLLCAGIAAYVHASHLLACMVLGAVVANRARHHMRPFHAIEGVTEPLLALFFLLAGFEFDIEALGAVGGTALAYLVARTVGQVLGGRAGAVLGRADDVIRRRAGWCFLPQAGVALGLALLASERLPELRDALMPLVIATTVAFELVGPVVTRVQLHRAGEIPG